MPILERQTNSRDEKLRFAESAWVYDRRFFREHPGVETGIRALKSAGVVVIERSLARIG